MVLWSAVRASAVALLVSSMAHAEIEHVVQKGHTLETIARRYRISVRAIAERNHFTRDQRLRPGEVVFIPTDAKAKGEKKTVDPKKRYVGRSPHPNVISAKRLITSEDFSIHAGRKPAKDALRKTSYMMRSPTGAIHDVDPRLVTLLGVVSDHFAGRKLEVVSGFRPFSPKQYTAHSNHQFGKAIDFRVVGVPNEVLRDFCRTLKNTGCGYYPNSVFVHMDVRTAPQYWIDYSKPGEAPRYHSPNANADEGTSDVHADQNGQDLPPQEVDAHGATPKVEPPEPLPAPAPSTTP